MAERNIAIVTASSNSGFQCLQDLLAYTGDLDLKIKAAFRTEGRAEEFMQKLSPSADTRNVEVVTGIDALKKESLTPAFARAEMAVIVTPHDPAMGTMERDSEMCLNMVEAAVASGTVKHIIYIGSWTTICPNDAKAIAARFVPTEERLAQLEGGITFTSLRSGFFNQNFALMMGSMAKAGKVFWPDIKIPSVDPRDMGTVAATICTSPTYATLHGGKHYQICGPDNLSTKELSTHPRSRHARSGIDICQVVKEISLGIGKAEDAIAYEAIPLAAFLDKVPFPPVREIFAAIEARPDLIPFSKDTELVTGKPPRSLRAWVEENKSAFLA